MYLFLQQPREKTVSETVWLCCLHGPVSALVHLNRTGLAPGETIRVIIDVNNKSRVKIDRIRVSGMV